MNAVFTMKDEALEKLFLQRCKEADMVGIKGHRSVGGFRVSMYNALPLSSIETLVELINQFAKEHA
jgi:phosphoserine aminotransferase